MGALVGDVPLPRAENPLLSALTSRSLRSPLFAVSLGADLIEGKPPAKLAGLTPPPDPAREWPKPTSTARSPVVPALVRDVSVWLAGVEKEVRASLPATGDHPDLAAWMLDSVPHDDVKTAREVLSRWGGAETAALARRIRAFAHALPAQVTGDGWPAKKPLVLDWEGHRVVVGTVGDDAHDEDAWLIVDPGGDDVYRNNAGGARGSGAAALCLDLTGNDRYETTAAFSQGAARFGAGILIDLSGDDVYVGSTFCQAAAVGGVGVLVDLSGDDR